MSIYTKEQLDDLLQKISKGFPELAEQRCIVASGHPDIVAASNLLVTLQNHNGVPVAQLEDFILKYHSKRAVSLLFRLPIEEMIRLVNHRDKLPRIISSWRLSL